MPNIEIKSPEERLAWSNWWATVEDKKEIGRGTRGKNIFTEYEFMGENLTVFSEGHPYYAETRIKVTDVQKARIKQEVEIFNRSPQSTFTTQMEQDSAPGSYERWAQEEEIRGAFEGVEERIEGPLDRTYISREGPPQE